MEGEGEETRERRHFKTFFAPILSLSCRARGGPDECRTAKTARAQVTTATALNVYLPQTYQGGHRACQSAATCPGRSTSMRSAGGGGSVSQAAQAEIQRVQVCAVRADKRWERNDALGVSLLGYFTRNGCGLGRHMMSCRLLGTTGDTDDAASTTSPSRLPHGEIASRHARFIFRIRLPRTRHKYLQATGPSADDRRTRPIHG